MVFPPVFQVSTHGYSDLLLHDPIFCVDSLHQTILALKETHLTRIKQVHDKHDALVHQGGSAEKPSGKGKGKGKGKNKKGGQKQYYVERLCETFQASLKALDENAKSIVALNSKGKR